MAGKALMRRLVAARGHDEVPGDDPDIGARIGDALAALGRNGGAIAPAEPQDDADPVEPLRRPRAVGPKP
jgi:hypothetical protein